MRNSRKKSSRAARCCFKMVNGIAIVVGAFVSNAQALGTSASTRARFGRVIYFLHH